MRGQIVHDYPTLKAGAQALSEFGTSLHQMGGQFRQIHQQLREHCAGDESGLGAAVWDATFDASDAGAHVLSQSGRVLGEMGARTDANTEHMFRADREIADTITGVTHESTHALTHRIPRQAGASSNSDDASGTATDDDASPLERTELAGIGSDPASGGLVPDLVRPYGGPGGLRHDDPKWQRAIELGFPMVAGGGFVVHADPRAGWVANGNDGGDAVPGRANNCADCARSFLASWYGEPTCAQPRSIDPGTGVDGPDDPERDGNDNIVDFAGTGHAYEGSGAAGYRRVAAKLRAAGPGCAAIVQIDWPVTNPATGKPFVDPRTGAPVRDPRTGQIPISGGHAFNAANVDGSVVWVDMQTNTVSDQPIHTRPDPVNVWSITLDARGKPLRVGSSVA